jgi:hypothetical protein
MGARCKFGLIALTYCLCAAPPLCAESQAWQAAIAKVTVRSDLNRTPGTAFVVAMRNQTAYLVTSAHVVAGDDSPTIEFRAAPDTPRKARTRNIQGVDPEHGLALLTVADPPASVRSLGPSSGAKLQVGESVAIGGYPNELGSFVMPSTTIASVRGQDLFLSSSADEGFSGGPVLRADGSVVGLIWGHTGSFGVAMVSDLIRLYLDGNDLMWGSTTAEPVTKGAPVGTLFQYTFTIPDGSTCNGEIVKISSTEWYERHVSSDPAPCLKDAQVLPFTEVDSDDPHYFLLYDNGRKLFMRLSNTAIGEQSPQEWRSESSRDWNFVHTLMRKK